MNVAPLSDLTIKASPGAQNAPPLKQAAEELSKSFFIQMLKDSGLEDVFSPKSGESNHFGFLISEIIAEKMVSSSPQLTDQLYRQLQGMEMNGAQ